MSETAPDNWDYATRRVYNDVFDAYTDLSEIQGKSLSQVESWCRGLAESYLSGGDCAYGSIAAGWARDFLDQVDWTQMAMLVGNEDGRQWHLLANGVEDSNA